MTEVKTELAVKGLLENTLLYFFFFFENYSLQLASLLLVS